MITEKYNQKWTQRFDFYESLDSKNPIILERHEFKNLPFKKRLQVSANFIAFFFGIIYMFVLGLWKKGISLAILIFLIEFGMCFFEAEIGLELFPIRIPLHLFEAVLWMPVANYGYYLKEVKGIQNWNPFEGFIGKSARERISKTPSRPYK